MIRVEVIDDLPLLRAGMTAVLTAAQGIEVVRASSSCEQGDRSGIEVDVVVVGLCTPPLGALGIVRRICSGLHPPPLLALCVQPDAICAAVYLRAGATGCALTAQSEADLVEAVTEVSRGHRYLPPSINPDDVAAILETGSGLGMDQLTQREHQVFGMLIQGASNDDIALRLEIAQRTVETHRRNIMRKLAAHSLADVLHAAARYGVLVSPPRIVPETSRVDARGVPR